MGVGEDLQAEFCWEGGEPPGFDGRFDHCEEAGGVSTRHGFRKSEKDSER